MVSQGGEVVVDEYVRVDPQQVDQADQKQGETDQDDQINRVDGNYQSEQIDRVDQYDWHDQGDQMGQYDQYDRTEYDTDQGDQVTRKQRHINHPFGLKLDRVGKIAKRECLRSGNIQVSSRRLVQGSLPVIGNGNKCRKTK